MEFVHYSPFFRLSIKFQFPWLIQLVMDRCAPAAMFRNLVHGCQNKTDYELKFSIRLPQKSLMDSCKMNIESRSNRGDRP